MIRRTVCRLAAGWGEHYGGFLEYRRRPNHLSTEPDSLHPVVTYRSLAIPADACGLVCFTHHLSSVTIILPRMSKTTLLEQLEQSGVNVDVDSYHLSWIKAVPFTPHDVTSNQIVIQQQIMLEENKELVEETIKEMKDAEWFDIYTVLVRATKGSHIAQPIRT